MKIFVREYPFFSAGYSIYLGYNNAWRNLGYETDRWDEKNVEKLLKNKNYIMMCTDHDLDKFEKNNLLNIILENSYKILCFVSANWMPTKFNIREYYCTVFNNEKVKELNKEKKIMWWGFGEERDRWGHNFCDIFNKVISLPLAYDQFTYKFIEDEKWKYDICFVGCYVNNGISYKERHIKEWIMSLKETNLKCGFFGMENNRISLEDEIKLIYNSKISLNVNDEYQLLIGLDLNERQFKSLGLNGFLISDKVWQAERLKLPSINCETKEEFHKKIFEYLEKDLLKIKEVNRSYMLENHTYVHRAKKVEKFL